LPISPPLLPKREFPSELIFGGQTAGTGEEILDYDNDGWPNSFVVNGTKLEGCPPARRPQAISTTMTTIALH
jgi:hypothetical protein